METNQGTDYRPQTSSFPSYANGCYTMHGILNYLQSEWTKMEMERAEWAVEKAELQTRIAFLQGECKGQENLKVDLVRRIKMLEFALVQERSKIFELKYPNDTNPLQLIPPGKEDYNIKYNTDPKLDEHALQWKEERTRLKDYLVSVGLGDVMNDLRTTRVRDIIASIVQNQDGDDKADSDPAVTSKTAVGESLQVDLTETKTDSAPPDFSPFTPPGSHEMFPDDELFVSGSGDVMEVMDPETAEALAEFDLLVAQQQQDPLTSLGDGEWNLQRKELDETEIMARFKERYRAERSKSSRQALHTSNYESVKDGQQFQHPMLSDMDEEFPTSQLDIDVKRPLTSIFHTQITPELDQMDGVPNTTEFRDSSAMQSTNSASSPGSISETSLGLGDLARLTVANDVSDDSSNMFVDNIDGVGDQLDSSGSSVLGEYVNGTHVVAQSKSDTAIWTSKYTLRSHFDSIRAILFHPYEPMLVTASEDHTLKMWNLNKTVHAKKTTNFDVEPVYTFRGHDHPVLSLALWTDPTATPECSNMSIYSGDLHGQLRSWRVSKLHLDPYDPFEPNVTGPLLRGHTDAVWSLAVHSDGSLFSASADGTVCLWPSPSAATPTTTTTILPSNLFHVTTSLMLASSFKRTTNDLAPVPTSISLARHVADKNQFFVGFTSGHIGLYDVETKNLIHSFLATNTSDNSTTDLNAYKPGSVTCVVNHPQQPLFMSAHEDRHIRFFDPLSGKCVDSMVAHLDAVTALTVDPQGNYLLSASHDCSIRLWNLHKKTCIQEITSHRKKFNEAIHTVAFHPTKRFMASAGADALAKVFI